MQIAFIGQSAFGEAVLQALADNEKDEIVGVFLTQGRGGKEDPVAETGRKLSLPVYQYARFREAQAVSQFEALEPELCVMAYVIDIVPLEMINAPARGTIQ